MGTTFASWVRRTLHRVAADPTFYPRVSVITGIGATIAQNIAAGTRGGVGDMVLAALIPLAFVLALESLIRVIRRCRWPVWIAVGIPLAGVSVIAGLVSYLHGYTVALWTGNAGLPARLIPGIPDLLIITGSVALVALQMAIRKEAVQDAPSTQPAPPSQPRPARVKPGKASPGKAGQGPRFSQAELDRILSPAALAQLSPGQEAEEVRIAGIVAQMAKPPSERGLAGDHCNGSRPMARRILARPRR
jgi:hypothetical protein